jgi:glycosyltransferase involved in cell wall biosynthesis
MRIAIIAEVFLPKVDGVVQRTLNLLRQLVDCGDDVLVVCPETGGCCQSPAPLVEFPSFPFPLYPEYRIGIPDRRLADTIKRFNPDVLHFVNPFAFGFVCYDLLSRTGVRVPSVFSFHTLYGEFVKQYRLLKPLSAVLWWLTREYHNRADVNLTVSTVAQVELVKRGFQRVRLWPPAVDSSLFHPGARSQEMRARLANGHSSDKVLLTVSRLAPEKNVVFLADVLDHVPDACLAIVGDGPQRAELERRFAGRRAHFMGYLKGRDLAAAYASADAFVYASETETMGNVILEAMASGCAVVAPNAGGIPSLLTSGESGLLYEPGEVQQAVHCTRLALEGGPFPSRLGRGARDWVESWNWSRSIDQVRTTYQESIDQFHPGLVRPKFTHSIARTVVTTLVAGFKSLSPRAQGGSGTGISPPGFNLALPLTRPGS